MRLLIVGMGYAGARIAQRAAALGWSVCGTTRDGRDGTVRVAGEDDAAALREAVGWSTHVLSSVPPDAAGDPVLAAAGTLGGRWLGYLSSTGVYGDTGGAWVDERAPTGGGRRSARADADGAWLAIGARVFRLPGIYGRGRSPLDRVGAGTAHRVDAPGQVFSRVHVDDLAAGVVAALRLGDGAAPPGAYNLADDRPCSQNEVVAFAARLLGVPPPPVVPLAALSAAARGFYAENRRVANGKAKRVLGWAPAYPDYRLGLRALSATTMPAPTSPAPAPASIDQR